MGRPAGLNFRSGPHTHQSKYFRRLALKHPTHRGGGRHCPWSRSERDPKCDLFCHSRCQIKGVNLCVCLICGGPFLRQSCTSWPAYHTHKCQSSVGTSLGITPASASKWKNNREGKCHVTNRQKLLGIQLDDRRHQWSHKVGHAFPVVASHRPSSSASRPCCSVVGNQFWNWGSFIYRLTGMYLSVGFPVCSTQWLFWGVCED